MYDAAAAGPAAGYVGPLGSCFVRKQPFEHVPLPGLPKRTACDIASGAMRLVRGEKLRGDISRSDISHGTCTACRRLSPDSPPDPATDPCKTATPAWHIAYICSPAASAKHLPVPIICRGGKSGAGCICCKINFGYSLFVLPVI